MSQSIKLQTSSILQVSLEKYNKDFIFNVNGQEYQTSNLTAELLSKKIAQRRSIDPTMNYFTIETRSKGNFDRFLDLQRFNSETYSDSEIEFILEIIEILDTEHVEMNVTRAELNEDNVLSQLIKDEKWRQLFHSQFTNEVKFVSKHFSEICSKQEEKLLSLSPSTIESIISNEELQLVTEDELLRFINKLYLKSTEYSILYRLVLFNNVETTSIEEFIDIFDINYLNTSTWNSITNRLKQKIIHDDDQNELNNKRYIKEIKKSIIDIRYENKEFEGIINYFRNQNKLEDEINLTSSSVYQGDLQKILRTDCLNSNNFGTQDEENSWICFEFKNHQVELTSYTIRANNWRPNDWHPRYWVVEGSNDLNEWTTLDQQNDNSDLNGYEKVHTFQIQNKNDRAFKYIKIRQTGKNWFGSNNLEINCIEFYGKVY